VIPMKEKRFDAEGGGKGMTPFAEEGVSDEGKKKDPEQMREKGGLPGPVSDAWGYNLLLI